MDKALLTRKTEDVLAIRSEIGQAANEAAARSTFANYRSRRAESTVRRQDAALDLFSEYLAQANDGSAPAGESLATKPAAWRGVTWGLVEGFVKWLLLQGYAVSTVNVRLSTIKTYGELATKAGALSAQELAMIRMVSGYSRKEAKRIDEHREAADIPTRLGDKKAEPIVLTKAQADALREQPDTPQGRRDELLIRLMLDLGLRCGEVAGLTVGDVDLDKGELRFYRPKVDKVQRHRFGDGLSDIVETYIRHDALAVGPLLRGSRKDGSLDSAGMTERAITERVRCLGERIGVEGLSAHDLRHTWATHAARAGTPLDRLQDAGGWASPAMPLRYIEAAKIANEGVRLG